MHNLAPLVEANTGYHSQLDADLALPEDIRAALADLEQLMYDTVDSEVPVLRDASRHILEAGGKRIRPKIALLAFRALGAREFERVLPVIAAVELVHTASVVHDDINDHGVMRRGRPSVNQKFGRTFALLTGDFLFTKVYELMAGFGDLNIVLAEATSALVEGETLQAAAVKDNNFTREVYGRIIALKTAALFRAGMILGARLANATPAQEQALASFGFNIGLAFQIYDDILDVIGTPEQLGKTAGIDASQGRGLTVAYAEDGSTDEIDQADPMVAIRKRVLKGSTIDEGLAQARALVVAAVEELNVLPRNEYRDALVQVANAVVTRAV
jgi:geranylgeranyl pyrophosphate synthase